MSLLDERRIYFDAKIVSLRGVSQCHGLSIPGVKMLGKFDHRTAKPPLAPHRHPGQVEISLLVRGCQSYRVNGKIYRMTGGQQFVTFPDELHDTAEGPEEKATLFWLILDTAQLCENWLFLTHYAAAAVVKRLHALPHRHFYAHPQSHSTMEQIFHLLREPATRFRNFEIAHHLMHYLFQTIEAERVGAILMTSAPIQKTIELIANKNNDEWIDLSTLARQAGLSVPRFKARFRHEMGLPPAEYMVRRKLEMAKRWLMTSASVTDVAYDLGFSSSQYFATVFRKYERQTPSQFIAAHSARSTLSRRE